MNSWHKYLAEGLGTFVFVFVACGAVLANVLGAGSLGTLGVALATGLALAVLIYGYGYVSGGHFNPAVTVSMAVTGDISIVTALGYIVSQLVGAVVAALAIQMVFSSASPQFFLGDGVISPTITNMKAIGIEALMTFFLVWTVYATHDKRAAAGFGPLCVGLMLAVGIMLSAGFTGGILNPARSFGPALISSHWAVEYVYWVGPLLGGIVAGLLYKFTAKKE